jgi:ribosomal protein S18 acetylase RimI-like enzyme
VGDLRARAAELNEQELWREMVRWSGGVVYEEGGLLFVAGPSRYLRVAMRLDADLDAATAVERVAEYFSDSEHIVLASTPDDADLVDAATARGYRPEWTYVAYAGGEPVSCAMTLVSHGVCGIFYVATVESARRRGLGEALTRTATRAGAAWLGASEIGAALYRRIGFEDLGTAMVEYESPA